MRTRRLLKLLHFCGTAWFILAAAYVIVLALRQAGVNWWLIFSFSGHGAAIGFLLVSAYLYALFRDNGRDPAEPLNIRLPIPDSIWFFIPLIPFLGTLASALLHH